MWKKAGNLSKNMKKAKAVIQKHKKRISDAIAKGKKHVMSLKNKAKNLSKEKR